MGTGNRVPLRPAPLGQSRDGHHVLEWTRASVGLTQGFAVPNDGHVEFLVWDTTSPNPAPEALTVLTFRSSRDRLGRTEDVAVTAVPSIDNVKRIGPFEPDGYNQPGDYRHLYIDVSGTYPANVLIAARRTRY